MPENKSTPPIDLIAYARAIASHLGPEWTVDEDLEPSWYVRLHKAPYELSVQRSRENRGRLSILAVRWPTYTTTERGGDVVTHSVTPRELHPTVKQGAPRITVDPDRGPSVVAADIRRRLLADYEALWNVCFVRAQGLQLDADTARDTWATVCALLGKPTTHTIEYADVPDTYLRLEANGQRVRLIADLTAEQVRAVLVALGAKGVK